MICLHMLRWSNYDQMTFVFKCTQSTRDLPGDEFRWSKLECAKAWVLGDDPELFAQSSPLITYEALPRTAGTER